MIERRSQVKGSTARRPRTTRAAATRVRAKGSSSRTNGRTKHTGARSAAPRSERTSRNPAGRTGSRASHSGRKAASSRSRTPAHKARGGARSGRHASPSGGRRASTPASYAVKLLRQDHRALLDRAEQFDEAGQETKHAIAEQLCRLLTVHMQIEEELLYPAAHETFGSDSLRVSVAQVEHALMKELVSQIEDMDEVDELFEAKIQVLAQLMREHIEEEERAIFPKLERTSLDLDALGEQLAMRKQELSGDEEFIVEYEEEESEGATVRGRRGAAVGRGSRSTLIHSGRR